MLLKALGIALKLTFQGQNQFVFLETYFCILVSAFCAAFICPECQLAGESQSINKVR